MNEYREGEMSTEVVVCRQKSVDGNLWTEICGRKSVDGNLWMEIVDQRWK